MSDRSDAEPAASTLGVDTIPGVVARAAELWRDEEAVVAENGRLTFAELDGVAVRAAAALVEAGIAPGDRVALWAPNSGAWLEAVLGAYLAGAVVVPVNTRFKAREAAYVLRAARVRLLFTVTDFLDTDYVEMLQGEDLPDLREIVVLAGPDRADTTAWLDHLARASADARVEVANRREAVSADDVSDILFTSGTTGAPKGAMLTHGATVAAYDVWSSHVGLRAGDRYLVINPFFHAFGLKAGIISALLRGATIVPHPVLDVPSVMRQVEAERITMLPGPPAIYQTILDHPSVREHDLSSLRIAVTGAAVVPVELIRRLRSELPFEIVVTGYGLTETTGVVTVCEAGDSPETIAFTSGRPLPGVEVRVVADGRDVEPGEPGEVLVRGYNVMLGYLDDPEATAATIDEDGWLRTGDIGVRDEAGNLRITDRQKDMFIVGGFNAYPAEIEDAILGHPDVVQVAVVGVPDERLGEVGFAFVVPRPGATVDPIEFISWCREIMANYKVPRHAEVVADLPLNASGKVLKFELRERAGRLAEVDG